jgi:DNA-directed RNA polymerase specialized sigma24 family protein
MGASVNTADVLSFRNDAGEPRPGQAAKSGMTRKEITVRQRLQMPQERLRIVRLCTLLTGDADVAEDMAQETLLEAWRSAEKLRDPGAWRPWLSGIARNVCLRWQRKHLGLVRRGAARRSGRSRARRRSFARLRARTGDRRPPAAPTTT